MRGKASGSYSLAGKPLSGDYKADVEELLEHLEIEKKRAEFLETQNRTLLTQLENSDRSSADANAAAMALREKLAQRDDAEDAARQALLAAEARIADAESRIGTLLAETTRAVADGEQKRDMLLAEKLTLEEEMEKLRLKVANVESTIMADWDTDRIEQSHLRERLNDIASDVSRLVYALEGDGLPDSEESLVDRIQKYVDLKDEEPETSPEPVPVRGPHVRPPEGPLSDRLKALQELREGN